MIKQYKFEDYSFSVFQKPKHKEHACGDSYWLKESEEVLISVIADGLGSGTEAHQASKAAIKTVRQHEQDPVCEIVQKVNEEQSAYRGVVLSIIKFHKKTRKLEFCGVGNIKFKAIASLSNVSQPHPTRGFLSGRPLDVEVHNLEISPNSWLLMYSDGIDLRNQDVASLYQILNSSSDETIEDQLKTTLPSHLNDDDVTLLIGKPN